MSDFTAFVALGFRHITSVSGMDHILFLLALAAIYRPRDWRDVLWVVTSFTLGHSFTLALAVTRGIALPGPLIEFLIPVTIVATCVENLAVRDREHSRWRGRYRPVLAAVFGLVHGAGFANYLRSLFMERIAVPLLGFNLGIELGQVVVLVLAGLLLALIDRMLAGARETYGRWSPFRVRVNVVSLAVGIMATGWAIQRLPALP